MVFQKQLKVMFSSVFHSKRFQFISNFFDPFGVLFTGTSKPYMHYNLQIFKMPRKNAGCLIDYGIPGIYYDITDDFCHRKWDKIYVNGNKCTKWPG
jgi:hypothetical protein